MANIETKSKKIRKQIKKGDILEALRLFLVLSSSEKSEVKDNLKELDIDLPKIFPASLKTIGGIDLYRINGQIKILSTSVLGNEYLKKILNSKEIKALFKEMITDYEDDLYNADLLKDAEEILEQSKDDEFDFKEIKRFIESLEEDEDCKNYMSKLINELRFVLNKNQNFNLGDIFFNNRFRYINAININLLAINLELYKINSLGFFLTPSINERDFILVKPYSYSDIERLFFIGVDKLKENIDCPVCENKKIFSQYIGTNTKLITVCKECSHIINLEEGF